MSYIEHLFDNTEEAAKNNRAEIDRYNKDISNAQNNNLKPLTQYFDFKDEKSSSINITGNVDFITDKKIQDSQLIKEDNVKKLKKSNKQPSSYSLLNNTSECIPFILEPNKSAIINYSNFKHSSYDGKNITGLSLFVTNDSDSKEIIVAYVDPTKGISVYNQNSESPISLATEYQFIDDKGRAVSFTEDKKAVVSISDKKEITLNGNKTKYFIKNNEKSKDGKSQSITFYSSTGTNIITPPRIQRVKKYVAKCRKPKCFNNCTDCCCQETIPSDNIQSDIDDLRLKLESAHEYVCLIRNSKGRDTGEALSRFAYFTWCFIRNYFNILANLIVKEVGNK